MRHRIYTFGDFALDLDRGALLRAGADVKLRPQSFAVLNYLVERHGKLVTRDELIDAIWGQIEKERESAKRAEARLATELSYAEFVAGMTALSDEELRAWYDEQGESYRSARYRDPARHDLLYAWLPLDADVERVPAEMLADLPTRFLEELRQTTLALNLEATLEVISRIADQAPEVATGLQELVDNYQVAELRELLGEVEAGRKE